MISCVVTAVFKRTETPTKEHPASGLRRMVSTCVPSRRYQVEGSVIESTCGAPIIAVLVRHRHDPERGLSRECQRAQFAPGKATFAVKVRAHLWNGVGAPLAAYQQSECAPVLMFIPNPSCTWDLVPPRAVVAHSVLRASRRSSCRQTGSSITWTKPCCSSPSWWIRR